MPAAVVSIIATDDDILGGVTSVTLSNVAGTFGIRNKETHEVVVPAGTPLVNSSAGLWEYALNRHDNQIYECAVRVNYPGGTLRFTQDVFAAMEPEADSFSDSETPPPIRGVDLIKEPVVREFIPGRGEFLRVRLSTGNEVLMPRHIFSYQLRPGDPHDNAEGQEEFLFVATPFDVTIYPVDAKDPSQIPGFYRKDSLDVYAASSEIAQFTIENIEKELAGLIANYNRLDRLFPTSEVILNGTGDVIDTPADPLTDPVDPVPSCPAVSIDDQLALYDELATATGDTVSLS